MAHIDPVRVPDKKQDMLNVPGPVRYNQFLCHIPANKAAKDERHQACNNERCGGAFKFLGISHQGYKGDGSRQPCSDDPHGPRIQKQWKQQAAIMNNRHQQKWPGVL